MLEQASTRSERHSVSRKTSISLFWCLFAGIPILAGPQSPDALKEAGPTLAKLEKLKGSEKKRASAYLDSARIYASVLRQRSVALDAYEVALAEAEENTKTKDREKILKEAQSGYEDVLAAMLRTIERGQEEVLEVAMKTSSKYYVSLGDKIPSGVKVPNPRFSEVIRFEGGYCQVNLQQGAVSKDAWFHLKDATEFRHRAGRKLSLEEQLHLYEHFLELDSTENYRSTVDLHRDDLVFEVAKKKNTRWSFQDYLTGFPKGKHRSEAEDGLEELAYKRAKRGDSATSYESYLEAYPNGRYAADVLHRKENSTFRNAKAINKAAAFEEYLRLYQNGNWTDEARENIERIHFETAKATASVGALKSFLSELPSDAYAKKAEDAIEEIYFDNAQEENTVDSYRAFIAQYPDGSLAKKAHWLIASEANSSASYSAFLDNFPDSVFTSAANTMLDYFRALDSSSVSDFEMFFKSYGRSHANIDSTRRNKILERLLEIASEQESAAGLLLLYGETGKSDFLAAAWPFVENGSQEAVIVKKWPEKFFGGDAIDSGKIDLNRSERNSFWLSNPIHSVRPVYRWKMRSAAKHGRYTIRIKVTLDVKYKRRYRGVTWFEPAGVKKDWNETHVAYGDVTLDPESTGWVEFRFPKISTGSKFGSGLAGSETFAKVDAEAPEIVSVRSH